MNHDSIFRKTVQLKNLFRKDILILYSHPTRKKEYWTLLKAKKGTVVEGLDFSTIKPK